MFGDRLVLRHVVKSFNHGWELYWSWEDKHWYYSDTNEVLDLDNPRPCRRCGRAASKEHPDPCLGKLPGVKGACCGHGRETGYVLFDNGVYLTGRFMNTDEFNAKEIYEFQEGICND